MDGVEYMDVSSSPNVIPGYTKIPKETERGSKDDAD